MMPKKIRGAWVYPKSADVLAAARLHPIEYYIAKRRETVLKAIEGRPLLEECRRAERLRGSPSRQYWWEQEYDLAGYEAAWEQSHETGEAGPQHHQQPRDHARDRFAPAGDGVMRRAMAREMAEEGGR